MHKRKSNQPMTWLSPLITVSSACNTGAKNSALSSPKISRAPSKIRCSSQEMIFAYSPSNLPKPRITAHKRSTSDANLNNLLKFKPKKSKLIKQRRSEVQIANKETSMLLKKALETLEDKNYLNTCKLLELKSPSSPKLQPIQPVPRIHSRGYSTAQILSKPKPAPSPTFKLAHLKGRNVIKAPKIFKNQIFTDIYDERGNHDRVIEMSDYLDYSTINSERSNTPLFSIRAPILLSTSLDSSDLRYEDISDKDTCSVEESTHELPKVMEINLKSKLKKLFTSKSRVLTREVSVNSECKNRQKHV